MPEGSSRDAEIFAEALRLPEAERAGYLDRACGHDSAARQRVERLLQVQGRVGSFLEETGDASGIGAALSAARVEESERVGRYRLIEKIGEGGCGVVYRAEQDEPIKRQVALKIIKPGMDTREVIARFEAERQALALMDHPGIAKVFDAGETRGGRPYFVMELIRGTKFTEYCDQHTLPTEARLKLFVQVCHAIQHAHQKGVIHRDIKPSNILVTTDAEGVPQPVVIDFGIAKATVKVRLTDKTLFTAVDMLVGTPTYMSPEQTRAGSSDVDTRADIYSLGVLLYELLTGVTPFDAGELLQLGIDEVGRAIREREPLRPSARLSRMSGGQLTTVAQRRGAEPPALVRAVRGDLDWIAMKALEKDRARRYATVNGLAADIGRVLANEPVSARPPSAAYRLSKTVARNRVLFASLSLVALFLLGGLVAVAFALKRERHARADADSARRQAEAAQREAEERRALAQTEATRSKHVTQFLQNVLLGVGPDVAQGRDTTILRDILERAAGQVSTELEHEPRVQAELRLRIGTVYADIQLLSDAEEQYRRGLEASRSDAGDTRELTVQLLTELGWVLIARGRFDDARAVCTEALELSREVFGPEHPQLARILRELGNIARRQGRSAESERLYGEALALQRRLLPADSPDLAGTLFDLSLVMDDSELRLVEVESIQREVRRIWIALGGPLGRHVDGATYALARTLGRQGKDQQALELARLAVDGVRTLQGADNPILSQRLSYYGLSLTRQHQLDAADAAYREALDTRAKLEPTVYRTTTISALLGIGAVAELRGRLAEAETAFREAFSLSRQYRSATDFDTAYLLHRLAGVLLQTGRQDEAERLFAEYPSPGFFAEPASAHFLVNRAHYFARQARWAEAVADSRIVAKLYPRSLEYRRMHATLLVAAGEFAEYHALQAALIADYRGLQTPLSCAKLAMACLLRPAEPGSREALARYGETAAAGGLEGKWAEYAQGVRALSAYRTSHYNAAIDWAGRTTRSLRPDLRVISRAVTAMAHHRLGDRPTARAHLVAAEQVARTDLPAPDRTDLGPNWIDWIHADLGPEWMGTVAARAVLAEARLLIDAAGEPAVADLRP